MAGNGFGVKDDRTTVAGPRGSKRQYDDVIDSMYKQLANGPQRGVKVNEPLDESDDERQIQEMGANLSLNDVRTPTGVAATIREGLRALAIHPFARTTPGVDTAVVSNPRGVLSQYVAKNYPAYYRHLDQPASQLRTKGLAENYRFEVVPQGEANRGLGMPNLDNRHGATVPRSGGRDADIYINEEVWKYLRDPQKLAALRNSSSAQDRKLYREVVTTPLHEMYHALNARQPRHPGVDDPNWGFPDMSNRVYNQLYEYVKGIKDTGTHSILQLSKGRVGPRHLEEFAHRYERAGYPQSVGVREAHVQRSAENAARSRGLLTRDEIRSDLTKPQIDETLGDLVRTPAQIADNIRSRLRMQPK